MKRPSATDFVKNELAEVGDTSGLTLAAQLHNHGYSITAAELALRGGGYFAQISPSSATPTHIGARDLIISDQPVRADGTALWVKLQNLKLDIISWIKETCPLCKGRGKIKFIADGRERYNVCQSRKGSGRKTRIRQRVDLLA